MSEHNDRYKWYILAFTVLTDMFVIAIPSMGMAVLAKEIAVDLRLNLVQVGIIWGVGALPGIATSLLGGMIGDKVGPRRVLIAGSLIAGILGMARGFAVDFLSMTILQVLIGAIIPVVVMNGYKAVGQWFPSHQLGLSNGVIAMSMALGFLIGSLLSATTFSPLLGGWRNVLIAYGLIGALFSVPWFFTKTAAAGSHSPRATSSIWTLLKHVAGLKNIWLLGLTLFGFSGAIQGTLGYLPLYLRGIGWQPIYADGALSAFHTVSLLFVLPIALWSDRLGSRKRLLMIANLFVAAGFALLSFVSGGMIWVAVVLSGFVRDAFMAMFTTMIIETDQVGPQYAGTATGFAMALGSLSNFIAPPLGNSLAVQWPGAPFAFWSVLCLLGVVCLSLVSEGSRSAKKAGIAIVNVPTENLDESIL
jgi:MFS family permease